MFKITLRTGCEILFRRILRRGQRVPCWLRVCYWQSIRILFRDTFSFLGGGYHEASPKYLDLFFK